MKKALSINKERTGMMVVWIFGWFIDLNARKAKPRGKIAEWKKESGKEERQVQIELIKQGRKKSFLN